MSFDYSKNLNNAYLCRNINFQARQSAVEKPLDKLARRVDEEKKKKQNKTAFAVGGSVLGLSILVTLLNPKMSSKLVQRLRTVQTKANQQMERSKGDFVKTKFYKVVSDVVGWSNRFLSWTNNINSVKDTYYKQLCTEDKAFYNVHNQDRRNRFIKGDKLFRRIMQKPHEIITEWGDLLAKRTVKSNYKTAGKRMDKLEKLIEEYSQKLSPEERSEISRKMDGIRLGRQYFTDTKLAERFDFQENTMKDLNKNIRNRWQEYKHGFRNQYVNNAEHFNQNLSFWAQDIMQPEREKLEQEGLKAVDGLFGNKNGLQGSYGEIAELLGKKISPEERGILEKAMKKTEKSLRKANSIECVDYFDKKRDLVLGSAPTDILSSAILLIIGGTSLASANDKDKKISRLIKSIIPTIAGVGVNIALTTMLFSGTKGVVGGLVAGGILSLLGSAVDKRRLAAKNKLPDEDE